MNDVADFLRTRRDRITPADVGLVPGRRRRVPGLRREEVALLAGISVEYYTQMERGDLRGVSEGILDAVAHALRLDEAEADHLAALAAASNPSRRRPRAHTREVSGALRQFLAAVHGIPAWVRDRRMSLVVMNPVAVALFAPIVEDSAARGNVARFVFLSAAAKEYFPDWELVADETVATMRTYAGANPHDKQLTGLVGELATRSGEFRARWAVHNVRHHRAGVKLIDHPRVGRLELEYTAMTLPEHPEWFMFTYTAAPGSPTADRLAQLDG